MSGLRKELATGVMAADGAMGTMLPGQGPIPDDFQQLEGCCEIVNVTRPGTKLPPLGHLGYTTIRDGYQVNAEGLLARGADALIVDTSQDLLVAAPRAIKMAGLDVPLLMYPACPDLEDQAKIADPLQAERIGVHLSEEEYQLHPEQSTDATVVCHPQARYFNAGGRS